MKEAADRLLRAFEARGYRTEVTFEHWLLLAHLILFGYVYPASGT